MHEVDGFVVDGEEGVAFFGVGKFGEGGDFVAVGFEAAKQFFGGRSREIATVVERDVDGAGVGEDRAVKFVGGRRGRS